MGGGYLTNDTGDLEGDEGSDPEKPDRAKPHLALNGETSSDNHRLILEQFQIIMDMKTIPEECQNANCLTQTLQKVQCPNSAVAHYLHGSKSDTGQQLYDGQIFESLVRTNSMRSDGSVTDDPYGESDSSHYCEDQNGGSGVVNIKSSSGGSSTSAGVGKCKTKGNKKHQYTCTIEGCERVFCSSGNLARHMKAHLGLKPFVCDYCQKRFGRAFTLTRHQITHTGQMPYKCDFEGCGKRFNTSGNLCRHRHIHEKKDLKKAVAACNIVSSVVTIPCAGTGMTDSRSLKPVIEKSVKSETAPALSVAIDKPTSIVDSSVVNEIPLELKGLSSPLLTDAMLVNDFLAKWYTNSTNPSTPTLNSLTTTKTAANPIPSNEYAVSNSSGYHCDSGMLSDTESLMSTLSEDVFSDFESNTSINMNSSFAPEVNTQSFATNTAATNAYVSNNNSSTTTSSSKDNDLLRTNSIPTMSTVPTDSNGLLNRVSNNIAQFMADNVNGGSSSTNGSTIMSKPLTDRTSCDITGSVPLLSSSSMSSQANPAQLVYNAFLQLENAVQDLDELHNLPHFIQKALYAGQMEMQEACLKYDKAGRWYVCMSHLFTSKMMTMMSRCLENLEKEKECALNLIQKCKILQAIVETITDIRAIQKDLITQAKQAVQVAANCVLNASQANLAERELQDVTEKQMAANCFDHSTATTSSTSNHSSSNTTNLIQ